MQLGVSVIHPCHGKGVVVDISQGDNVIRFETGFRIAMPDSDLKLTPIQNRKQGKKSVQTDKAIMALLSQLLKS